MKINAFLATLLSVSIGINNMITITALSTTSKSTFQTQNRKEQERAAEEKEFTNLGCFRVLKSINPPHKVISLLGETSVEDRDEMVS
ncbi:hypothetical protein SDJN02_00381, partial [Cucurbita argyrosperma subsp. argyrosperma]